MPVWHEATRNQRESGKLQLVGIVQEQHPDRAKLYAQWKKFDWPILVDSLNLLQVAVVPAVLLLDEQGIVRAVLRNPKGDLPAALRTMEDAPLTAAGLKPKLPSIVEFESVRDLIYFRDPPQYTQAIDLLARFPENHPNNGPVHFALGVVLRARFDSALRADGDFQRAVDHWQRALEIDPNQYIWRRRIQQYGPRSDKPYPFYDWVAAARREIQARGGVPVGLAVEPAGSELALPARDFALSDREPARSPDPESRVRQDDSLVGVEVTVVPPRIRVGQAVRVHVALQPTSDGNAHWNNESGPTQVFVHLPRGWTASETFLPESVPNRPTSDETRTIEFELQASSDAQPDDTSIVATAFYHLCLGQTGECVFLRKGIKVPVELIRAER